VYKLSGKNRSEFNSNGSDKTGPTLRDIEFLLFPFPLVDLLVLHVEALVLQSLFRCELRRHDLQHQRRMCHSFQLEILGRRRLNSPLQPEPFLVGTVGVLGDAFVIAESGVVDTQVQNRQVFSFVGYHCDFFLRVVVTPPFEFGRGVGQDVAGQVDGAADVAPHHLLHDALGLVDRVDRLVYNQSI
jgi:hypothetical protein